MNTSKILSVTGSKYFSADRYASKTELEYTIIATSYLG